MIEYLIGEKQVEILWTLFIYFSRFDIYISPNFIYISQTKNKFKSKKNLTQINQS